MWSFDTVGSKDLWGDPSVNSGGGAWYPPAIDPKTKLMYWGIGNPAPFGFDAPDDIASVPDLNSNDRVVLTGRVRILKLGAVNGKGVLDASGLLAEEIEIGGDMASEASVTVNAPPAGTEDASSWSPESKAVNPTVTWLWNA